MSRSKLNESLTKFQLRPFVLQLLLRLFSSQSWRSAQSIREKKSNNHEITLLFRYFQLWCFKSICFFTEKSLFENLKPRVTSFCRLEKEYMTMILNHWLKTYSINILYRPITTMSLLFYRFTEWEMKAINRIILWSAKSWPVRLTTKWYLIMCK